MLDIGKRIRGLVMDLPAMYTAFVVLGLALAAGWGGHAWVGKQVALPEAIERNSANISALEARVNDRLNDMSGTVETLVQSQSRLTARLETLICLLDAEHRNLSVFGCPR